MKRRSICLVAVAILLGLAAPAFATAPTSGIDTPTGVLTLPLSVQGTEFVLLDDTTPTAPVVTIGSTSLNINATINGTVFAAGYFHNSDARLKTNIRPVDGLATIEQLQGVSYNWKKDGTPGMGILAQDVEKVIPGAVRVSANGYKAVEYDQLMGPMIEAIKELKAQNDRQAAEIEELRKEIRE